METLQGQLLIASPSLLDPNFRRAVVLITEHNEEGGRFWRKSNENIIVFLDDEGVIETEMSMFCWASLSQIKELALIDNVMSPFVRTIIAPL